MSKCDLSIDLDRSNPTFLPGEELCGSVDVLVDSSCRCDSLDITLGWETHGKGNRDKGPPLKHSLGPFEWKAGERHRHDFSFTMPAGPVSYHGQIINVDWYLRVRADIPWALDPKTSAEVLLMPAPAERVAADGYRAPPRAVARPHDVGLAPAPKVPAAMVVVPMLLALGVFTYVLWPFVADDGTVMWPNVIFMAIVVVLMGRMIYSQLRNAVAKRKLGSVQVDLDPPEATSGQTVQFEVAICPDKQVTLNGVSADLVCEEVAVSGSGTNKTTHRRELHRQQQPLCQQGRDIRAGEQATFEGQVKLPACAAPTFRADDNNVRWNLIVHVDIPMWPDLKEEHELVVLPS